MRVALLHGVIKQTGNTFSFGERKLGVGVEQTKNALKADKDLFKEVRTAALKASEEKKEVLKPKE